MCAVGLLVNILYYFDQMKFKLGRALYAIKYVEHFMPQNTLQKINLSYFLCILSYGIIS